MSSCKKLDFFNFGSDPGGNVCNCNNVCNRRKGRGGCPCLQRDAFCTTLCNCGSKKMACSNRPQRSGSILSAELELPETDEEADERLILSFEDEENIYTLPYTQALYETLHETSFQDLMESSMEIKSPKQKKMAKTKRKGGKNNKEEHKRRRAVQTAQPADPVGEASNSSIQEKLDNMTHGELQVFCVEAIRRHSDLVDILGSSQEQPLSPGPASPGGPPIPNWCKCGRCRAMEDPAEQVCCRRVDGQCVVLTAAETFRTSIVNRQTLVIAILDHNDMMVYNIEPNNQYLRNAAYRQFVLWKYGRLGEGNRVVIPSCVVWKIRATYPSDDGTYVGFRPGRFRNN